MAADGTRQATGAKASGARVGQSRFIPFPSSRARAQFASAKSDDAGSRETRSVSLPLVPLSSIWLGSSLMKRASGVAGTAQEPANAMAHTLHGRVPNDPVHDRSTLRRRSNFPPVPSGLGLT